MSIGIITNDTVQQVNFNGGTDNVNQIDIVKNGTRTTVWQKQSLAVLSVPFYRDDIRGNNFAVPRQGGYDPDNTGIQQGQLEGYHYRVMPEIVKGGIGYRNGQVLNVNIPNTIPGGGVSFMKMNDAGEIHPTRRYIRNGSGYTQIYNIRGAGEVNYGTSVSPDFKFVVTRVKPADGGVETGVGGVTGSITQIRILQSDNNYPANYLYAQRYDIFKQTITLTGTGQRTYASANAGEFFRINCEVQDPTGVAVTNPNNTGVVQTSPGTDTDDAPEGWLEGPNGVFYDPNALPVWWNLWIANPNLFDNAGQVGNPLSDIRVKENIEFTGLSNSGLKIYEFDYIHKPGRYQGVMAQDLLEIDSHHPAVITDADGYYRINYNYTDVEFKKIK